jgi:hypothetical protein
VDCNWSLLNTYKSCEEKYNKTSTDYVDCTAQAKQVYQQCLSAIKSE